MSRTLLYDHIDDDDEMSLSSTRNEQDTIPINLSRLRVWELIWQATAMWAVTRVAFLLLTMFANAVIYHMPMTIPSLVQRWNHWDVYWYLAAARGYDIPESAAFFPLYPSLIALITSIIHHPLVAALLISNLATLGAYIALVLLAAYEEQDALAGITFARIFMAYPMAFFMTAPYTESLFIAAAAACLLLARRGNWWWAAFAALVAGLTRFTAIILIIPLLLEYGRQSNWWGYIGADDKDKDQKNDTFYLFWKRRFVLRDKISHSRWNSPFCNIGEIWRGIRDRKKILQFATVIGAIPVAVVGYWLYLWYRFGSFWFFFTVQREYWHHERWLPWNIIYELIQRLFVPFEQPSHDRALELITISSLVFFGGLTLWSIRRLPFIYTLYMTGLLLLVCSAIQPELPYLLPSAGRYLLESLPAFLMLSRYARRHVWLDFGLVSCGLLLQSLFTLAFMSDIWIE
jgi:hypothetical protein